MMQHRNNLRTDLHLATETEMFLLELEYPGISVIHKPLAEWWTEFGSYFEDMVLGVYTRDCRNFSIRLLADNELILHQAKPVLKKVLGPHVKGLLSQHTPTWSEKDNAYALSIMMYVP